MKYIVHIKESHSIPVEVDAENQDKAREIVNDWLANYDERIDFSNLNYSHTENPSSWYVEKKGA